MNYENLIQEIKDYRTLPYNWDGYEGIAPSNRLIDEVLRFIELTKETFVCPKVMLASEEISLYWNYENCYLEVTFDKIDGCFTYFEDCKENGVLGEDDIPFNSLGDILKYLNISKIMIP